MLTGRNCKHNRMGNKGFSLVELVVVIAIVVVLATVGITYLSSINRYNVKKMAETFDSGLSRTQALCMAKQVDNSVYMQISITDDKKIMMDIYGPKGDQSHVELGHSENVKVEYSTSGSSDRVQLTKDAPIYITYKRASGSLNGVGTKTGDTISYSSDNNYKHFYFSTFDGSKEVDVEVYPLTGKHKVNS